MIDLVENLKREPWELCRRYVVEPRPLMDLFAWLRMVVSPRREMTALAELHQKIDTV